MHSVFHSNRNLNSISSYRFLSPFTWFKSICNAIVITLVLAVQWQWLMMSMANVMGIVVKIIISVALKGIKLQLLVGITES